MNSEQFLQPIKRAQEIRAKYPKIFPKPVVFECGEGWFDLIDTLCDCIQRHVDWRNRDKENIPQPTAAQIKEKFGGLRFYIDGYSDEIGAMIQMVEDYSYYVCEACGNKGSPTKTGWIRTLCDKHKEESK